jgi:copper chaperone CopZ
MTCGSCAARIERRLNRLDGVVATVNYATGRAYVTQLGGRDPGELIGVISSTGYTPSCPCLPQPAAAALGPGGPRPGLAARHLRPPRRGRHRARYGAVRAVHRLAVGEPAAGRAGRDLGRVATAPGPPGSASATPRRRWTRWSAWE